MNKELLEALEILEKEKNISKAAMLEAIENSLLIACKNHFGKADNIHVNVNPETGDYAIRAEKEVVEQVEDPVLQISLAEAKMIDPHYELGNVVQLPVESKSFGRIATQSAKNVILQKIREEERRELYNDWFTMEKDVVTGIVQRSMGHNISVNLGKVDAMLSESEQVKGETLLPTERIKVYVLNPAFLIENALSPAKVICVVADEDAREAQVIVPDYQLSLAIGKEGQNARLAAKLTGYKIDIKSEAQARELGLFEELGLEYQQEGGYVGYQEDFQNPDTQEENGYQDEYQDYQDETMPQ